MRLLHANDLTFKDFLGDRIPLYAIVSHRWSEAELSYQSFLRDKEQYVNGHLESYGWTKIVKGTELALQCDLQWIWIDTICINKESSAELTQAINSMYSWYRLATECFVFLPDVHYDEAWMRDPSRQTFPAEVDMIEYTIPAADDLLNQADPEAPIGEPFAYTPVRMYEEEFMRSAWFKRSWTLQELLAPDSVVFFNSKFQSLGTRHTLSSLVNKATNIPVEFLRSGDGSRWPITAACIAERMRWASHREATRIEDRAYSLLGLFQVNLPLMYGEGDRAFRRLQLEIIKETNDESIVAWTIDLVTIRGLSSTDEFPVLSRSTKMFSHVRAERCALFQRKHYEVTNMGLRFTLPVRVSGVNKPSSQQAAMVREELRRNRFYGYNKLLFPLNCVGTCKGDDGTIYKGLLALYISIDHQRSHQDLKILVGARFRDLLISDDITSEEIRDAEADILTADGTLYRKFPISTRRWIYITTGIQQSFDLVVDSAGGSAEDEYTLYLKL
jgi:hypothetical protein